MLPTPRQLNANDDNPELEAIRDLQKSVSGAQRTISVKTSMANAENINLIAGEGDPFDDSGTDPFTGTAILYPAFQDATGDWHIIGMNAGVLQFGLSALDGAAYAGGGAVRLDKDGVSIVESNVVDDFPSQVAWTYNGARVAKLESTHLPLNYRNMNLEVRPDATHIDSVLTMSAIGYSGSVAALGLNSGFFTGGGSAIGASADNIKFTGDLQLVGNLKVEGNIDVEENGNINSNLDDVDSSIFGTDATAVIKVDAGNNEAVISNLAVTGTLNAASVITSGTYTPTLYNTTNVAASTANVCVYMRVGNVVHVSGRVVIDPTSTGNTVLGMDFPIASNINGLSLCGGVASTVSLAQPFTILGDITNYRATFQATVTDTASRAYYFTFQYYIL